MATKTRYLMGTRWFSSAEHRCGQSIVIIAADAAKNMVNSAALLSSFHTIEHYDSIGQSSQTYLNGWNARVRGFFEF
jgi:hypothetical protein